jgi:hypothetical protein
VSPFITDLPDLVCKNKNIEGGMGIHFFKNAAFGGDWILQEKMVIFLLFLHRFYIIDLLIF